MMRAERGVSICSTERSRNEYLDAHKLACHLHPRVCCHRKSIPYTHSLLRGQRGETAKAVCHVERIPQRHAHHDTRLQPAAIGTLSLTPPRTGSNTTTHRIAAAGRWEKWAHSPVTKRA